MEEKTEKIMNKRNLVLFIIFSVLVMYVLIYNGIINHKKKMSHTVFSFLIGDVLKIQLYNDKNNFILQRQGSSWIVPELPKIVLSKLEIDSFLDDLRNIKIMRKINAPSAINEYGFENLNHVPFIGLNLEKNKNIKIYLGNELNSKKAFYVLYNQQIYIVDKSVRSLFLKDLFQFRDKHIFSFLSQNVNYLKIVLNNSKIILKKVISSNGSAQWYVRYPEIKKMSTDKMKDIHTFLFELEELKTLKIIEGKQLNLEYFGVPSFNYVRIGTEQNQFIKAVIGKKTEKGYYFFLENRPNIMYIVDTYFVEHTLRNYIAKIKETSHANK